ncbi:hypothetical protein [Microbulbifer sp.]|uniref:hypothetical protein n=1 Tax=Microbulbifer sp. TaxID=1908541 RepID=UPI00258F71EC|nr:hypothetical protein [Microbulbifer sp.]
MPRPEQPDIDPTEQEGQTRTRAANPDRDDIPEEETAWDANPLSRAEATFALAGDWFANLQALARAEFTRTLTAAAQILGLSLILLPLAVALIVSLCAGVGLAGYYFSQSVYIGFGVFILTQLLLLTGIVLYQRKLRRLIGFDETRRQVKEALNDVTESLK